MKCAFSGAIESTERTFIAKLRSDIYSAYEPECVALAYRGEDAFTTDDKEAGGESRRLAERRLPIDLGQLSI